MHEQEHRGEDEEHAAGVEVGGADEVAVHGVGDAARHPAERARHSGQRPQRTRRSPGFPSSGRTAAMASIAGAGPPERTDVEVDPLRSLHERKGSDDLLVRAGCAAWRLQRADDGGFALAAAAAQRGGAEPAAAAPQLVDQRDARHACPTCRSGDRARSRRR